MRIYEPLLTRVLRSGVLTAATLTALNMDFEFGRNEAAMIYGAAYNLEPSATTANDDQSITVIARPDYQVVSVTDFLEPMNDPDFVTGYAQRTSIVTEGGMLQLMLVTVPLPEPMLVLRNLSILFFDDNAVELGIVLYYKLAELTDAEVVGSLVGGR